MGFRSYWQGYFRHHHRHQEQVNTSENTLPCRPCDYILFPKIAGRESFCGDLFTFHWKVKSAPFTRLISILYKKTSRIDLQKACDVLLLMLLVREEQRPSTGKAASSSPNSTWQSLHRSVQQKNAAKFVPEMWHLRFLILSPHFITHAIITPGKLVKASQKLQDRVSALASARNVNTGRSP